MARLLRPPIPVEIKCRVAMRQLGEMYPDAVIRENRFTPRDHRNRSLGKLLESLLTKLAALLNCEVTDLDLDHDPALENRDKVKDQNGVHIDYKPAANDPEYLYYRPRGPQFERSHKIKTTVRGDHGQHSDAGLARKLKRIAKNRDPNRRKAKIAQRKNPWGTKKRKMRSKTR